MLLYLGSGELLAAFAQICGERGSAVDRFSQILFQLTRALRQLLAHVRELE